MEGIARVDASFPFLSFAAGLMVAAGVSNFRPMKHLNLLQHRLTILKSEPYLPWFKSGSLRFILRGESAYEQIPFCPRRGHVQKAALASELVNHYPGISVVGEFLGIVFRTPVPRDDHCIELETFNPVHGG